MSREPAAGSAGPVDPPALRRFLLGYGAATVALLLFATPLSFVHPELGAFRNWQIGLNAILFLVWLHLARLRSPSFPLPRALLAAFAAAIGLLFLVCQLCRFYGLTTNGVDFSIFDWMLYSTGHGAFGYSPIYGVNHFGVHPSYILLPLVPIHRLVESPLLLVLTTAVALWAAIFPLWRLAMHYRESEVLAALAVLAYATNPWVGTLLDGGFRPELFYPVLGLTFALGWVRERPVVWLPALVAFLSIKEDAALYVAAFALAALLFERLRWRAAAAILALSIALLVLNVGWIQPLFLAGYGEVQPDYLKFWGHYGSSISRIALAMLTSPVRVVADVATSGWYRMFAPALFLPLGSRLALAAMLPALFLLGTTSYPAMRDYKNYYPVPLVPFLLFGLLEVYQRLARWPWGARWRDAALVTALLLWPLVGGGYIKFARPNVELLRELRVVEEKLARAPALCVQTILFPHLPYALKPRPLDRGCTERQGAVSVINPRLDPFPYARAQLERMISQARADGRLEWSGSYALATDLQIEAR